jgi:hypothetical protein
MCGKVLCVHTQSLPFRSIHIVAKRDCSLFCLTQGRSAHWWPWSINDHERARFARGKRFGATDGTVQYPRQGGGEEGSGCMV